MSEPEKSLEKFLERWSRRKLAAAERTDDKAPGKEQVEQPGTQDDAATRCADAASDRAAPPFDPASLPPIQSINAASDVRAFLAPGVPVELTRAALRRAWATDPTIRDFVGIAENQWDFTRPDGAPGFGPLDLTPELRRLVSELCGNPGNVEHGPEDPEQPSLYPAEAAANATAVPAVDAAAPRQAVSQTTSQSTGQTQSQASEKHSATQAEIIESAPEQLATHKHGAALPR